MKRIPDCFSVVLLTPFFACVLVYGQGSTAQISGTVRDQSAAVLPGVDITVTQTETGASRSAISNETGTYVLSNLPVGPYRLEGALPGFRTFVQTGIVLQVNSSPAINIVMDVGQVTETIEVQANASMVETRSTGVGQVIDNARIMELPLIGRQVTDLVLLSGAAVQAGVATAATRAVYPGVASFSIAGGFVGGNTVALDGAMHNDVYANSGLPLPFPDALQEFKVETSAVPAQYGYHSGAALTAVTKSGGNEYHGDLFEFVRNYKFNTRNFFAATRDSLKRNQFGGTFGGPIRQNKLFFFGAYQGTITRESPSSLRAFVPTPQMLSGDFTALASIACGREITLASPFANNRIDPSRLSPAAINITKRLPAPIDQCGLVEYGNPVRSDAHMYVGKVDYNRNSNHSMFGRYMAATYLQPDSYSVSQNPLSSTLRGSDQLFQGWVFGDTRIFGSGTVNALRLSWNRSAMEKIPADFFGPADVGLNIYSGYTPKTFILSISSGFNLSGGGSTRVVFANTVAQIADDLSLIRGNHQMSFGADVQAFRANQHAFTWTGGFWTINGGVTGHGLADFLIGRVQSFNQGAPFGVFVRQRYLGAYAQDAWKVRPNLTLSYGLRWEPTIPQQYEQDQNGHFDFAAFQQGIKSKVFLNAPPGLFYPGDPQFGDNGSSPIPKDWKTMAPRIGIVWDPTRDGKTVVRTGYGIFYERHSVELNLAMTQGPPWGGRLNIVDPVGGLDNPWQGYPGGNPFPTSVGPNTAFPDYGVFTTYEHNSRVPYVQQWNFGVQRQLGENLLVSASYIGNQVIHLYGSRELNPAIFFPGSPVNGVCRAQGFTFATTGATCSTAGNTDQRRLLGLINPVEGKKYGFVANWDDGGTRSYHGLLVNTQKRLSRGFSMTANWTWSHCIGNPTNTLLQGTQGSGVYQADTRAGDRGNCTTSGDDFRHLVNMTGIVSMPRFSNNVLNVLASNWRLSGIFRADSGSAFTIVSGSDRDLTGRNASTQYASQLAPDIYGNKCTDNLRASSSSCVWLNRAAFEIPAFGARGNMGPGTARGPGSWVINAGLTRLFSVTERQRLEFRAEANNILNHTNFNNPSGNVSSAQFGRIQSAGDGRVMQFALKYVF
jgi:hypothetical protein